MASSSGSATVADGRRPRASWALAVAFVVLPLVLAACGSEERSSPFLPLAGVVEGFVVDLGTNPPSPVIGATVYPFPDGVRDFTDAAGFYRLEGILPGTYEIKVTRGPGQNESVQRVTVRTGETVRIDFTFNPPANDQTRELIFITDDGPAGRIATINGRGDFLSGEFRFLSIPLAGSFRSLRMSRVSLNEAVILSNTGSGSNPPTFDVYLLGFGAANTATRVTNTANQKQSVDLSPDGSQIVLSQDTDNDQLLEIWILNRDGTSSRRLVDDIDGPSGFTFDNRDVDWSHDGTTISFTSRRTDIQAPLDQTDLELTTTPVIGGPLMQVTRDINDDFTPFLASRDLSVWYSKLIGGVRQLFLAPLDANAIQTQLTAASLDQTDPVVSNDRRLLAWVSRDDIDGTNPDLSAEISVGDIVGTTLVRPRHVSLTPPGLDLDYLSLQWRRR